MVTLILLAVLLVVMLCVLAFRLATFALPLMLAFEAARFAYATGAGWIGIGIVGFFAGVASFGILAPVCHAARTDPAHHRGRDLCGARRRGGLCPRARHRSRSGSFGNLAPNLLHRRRHIRRLLGAGEAGRPVMVSRGAAKTAGWLPERIDLGVSLRAGLSACADAPLRGSSPIRASIPDAGDGGGDISPGQADAFTKRDRWPAVAGDTTAGTGRQHHIHPHSHLDRARMEAIEQQDSDDCGWRR